MTPGTKVAVISKSASSDTLVAPSEEKAGKDAPQPSPPAKEEKMKKETLKAEAPIKEKPKASSPAPPKTSASEPQLPPKERERRVSLTHLSFIARNVLLVKHAAFDT